MILGDSPSNLTDDPVQGFVLALHQFDKQAAENLGEAVMIVSGALYVVGSQKRYLEL